MSENNIEVTDLQCAVCFNAFFQPVSIPPCCHNFCRPCIMKVLEMKQSCPLCRQDIPSSFAPSKAPENADLALQSKTKFPAEYEERNAEWNKELEAIKYQIIKKVRLGNEHQEVTSRGENTHLWKLYLRDDEGVPPNESILPLIEKVQIELHPTFRPSKVTLQNAPFEISRTGWGVFQIGVKITFFPEVNAPAIETTHMLSFSRNDTFKVLSWKFDSRHLQAAEDVARAPQDPLPQSQIETRARALQNLMLNHENRRNPAND